MESKILITESSTDYELLDSGEDEKLERFGKFILSRPDPQALWPKRSAETGWKKADGYFTREESRGDWSLNKNVAEKWQIEFAGMKLWIKPTAFKHVGIFPEQAPNWEWMKKAIHASRSTNQEVEVLNLFAYTGAASLACAEAGAKVVHVDSSKVALTWARENAETSGLADKPIRWILDDARTFVRREVKRGRKYHGIIMDPPAFGHGPENELWKIEDHFLPLLEDCMNILADQPIFFLINGYSAGYSALAYENNLLPLVNKFGGKIEMGELAIRESSNQILDSRTLPAGIFARWAK